MRYGRSIMALVSVAGALTACDSDDTTGPIRQGPNGEPLQVIEASGNLAVALADFQAAVGQPANGGGVGPQPGGRREIRWDGVPADQTNTDAFPDDFFKGAGLISTTDGIGTRVSDNDFADIDPSYAGEFESFSKAKTFMASGSARLTLRFRVPGTDTEAAVNGFGIVFSDIDRDGAAHITLYALDGTNLGNYTAPVRSDSAGHSFVGVVFEEPIIGRVEVTSGEAPLGAGRNDLSGGGVDDLVVTDDFLFGEPQPEPQGADPT